MKDLFVTTSPHLSSKRTTQSIMQDVVIALMPAVIASFFIFGFYPLLTISLCVSSCVLAEFLYCKITKQKCTVNDFSAVVTGLILALNLPPVVPVYVPIVGSFFAIMLVKMLFGGLGKNFANPAATARVFLVLAWTSVMTKYVAPIDITQGTSELFKYFGSGAIDSMTSATPLASIKAGNLTNVSLLDLFLGNVGGCLGEVSALALLIGGIYLVARKVIDYKVPLVIFATVGIFTWIFKGSAKFILPSILSGGVMLGAIFMATDYASSPNTNLGRIIFAFGIGFITVLCREIGSMNEGMSFAILLMNLVVPLIDKLIVPKPFGYVKPPKEKKEVKNEKA